MRLNGSEFKVFREPEFCALQILSFTIVTSFQCTILDATLRSSRQKLKYSIRTHFANIFSKQSTNKPLDKFDFEWPTEGLHNYLSSVIKMIKTLKVTHLHFQVRLICKRIVKDTQTISKEFSTHTGCNCLGIKI